MRCHAFKKQTVYQLYNFGLFRVHNHFSIRAFVISEKPAVGNTNLTIVERTDILFFKITLHVIFFQKTNGCQAVNSISCKTAHTFCYDKVNFSCHCVRYHSLKALSAFGGTTADTLISVHPNKLLCIQCNSLSEQRMKLTVLRCRLTHEHRQQPYA